METLSIVFIIVSVILVILLVALFIAYINLESSTVDPKNYPNPTETFGLNPGKNGKVLTSCTSGVTNNTSAAVSTNTGSCSFVNVPDLVTATNLCNAYSQCKVFSYSSQNNTMMILEPNQVLIDDDTSDVYIRQIPTISV